MLGLDATQPPLGSGGRIALTGSSKGCEVSTTARYLAPPSAVFFLFNRAEVKSPSFSCLRSGMESIISFRSIPCLHMQGKIHQTQRTKEGAHMYEI